MRVIALLTVRNEQRYLSRCLEHLYSQGIETCVIDNGSTDRTLEIARTFLDRGVFRIEQFPFNGCFEFKNILINSERLANEIDADWFILQAADEILEAISPYKTILEGIEDADRQGYNVINFDEFVFLPTQNDESFEGLDYVQEMHYYYFFEPEPFRLQRAWRKTPNLQLSSGAGHKLNFSGKKIFPRSFILRHYMVQSRAHALVKYGSRIYSQEHKVKGWSQDRRNFSPDKLNFPARECLKRLDVDGTWDRSEPWKKHEFLLGERSTIADRVSVKRNRSIQLNEAFEEKLDRSVPSSQTEKYLYRGVSSLQSLIPENKPMTTLILANMHRSGSSLVAALLQRAGLKIGQRLNPSNHSNIKGHFENLDFYDFHQAVLRSQNLHEDGWTTQNPTQVEDRYLDEAKAIISQNSQSEIWGWKEPRTTLFLDFWHQLIPEAKFLFIYRAPWDVIDSLYRRGDKIFQTHPELAIQLWLHYNQKILNFFNQFPNSCFLANIQTIIHNEAQYIEAINQKFHTKLKPPQAPVYEPLLFKTIPSGSYRPSLMNHDFPEVVEMYRELETKAWHPDEIQQAGQQLPERTVKPAEILQDWLACCRREKQNQRLQQDLEQTQKELVQTQAQMHQIQEELEQYYINPSKQHPIQLTPTPTPLQSPEQQYQLFVQQAFTKYQESDLTGMTQCLQQSLTHTPFSRIETMVDWVETFARFSTQNGNPLNTSALTDSPEWKQLMQQLIQRQLARA